MQFHSLEVSDLKRCCQGCAPSEASFGKFVFPLLASGDSRTYLIYTVAAPLWSLPQSSHGIFCVFVCMFSSSVSYKNTKHWIYRPPTYSRMISSDNLQLNFYICKNFSPKKIMFHVPMVRIWTYLLEGPYSTQYSFLFVFFLNCGSS